jgi:hypothetical protein
MMVTKRAGVVFARARRWVHSLGYEDEAGNGHLGCIAGMWETCCLPQHTHPCSDCL